MFSISSVVSSRLGLAILGQALHRLASDKVDIALVSKSSQPQPQPAGSFLLLTVAVVFYLPAVLADPMTETDARLPRQRRRTAPSSITRATVAQLAPQHRRLRLAVETPAPAR